MFYNPLDKFYKSITGAVPDNTDVKFRVKGNFDSVFLLLKKDGYINDTRYQMDKKEDFFEITIKFERGLYYYCFMLTNNEFIGVGTGVQGIKTCTPERFQLTVYPADYNVPEWLSGGIIYQIFPDRFCKSERQPLIPNGKILHDNWLDTPTFLPNEQGQVMNNDFFGGDLKGIISKLDYLSQLGVTAIYLNPIFEAFSNHRYDTGDYMKIDSLLGDENDFIDLINQAREKGISIILDGVFNHTGDDSVYFNRYGNYDSLGAYQSKKSPYYSWYNFIDYPNVYDSWWGIKTLPAINECNDAFIDYITGENGVLEHYTKLGVSGWRLDVVDELPDEFVKKIRSAIKKNNPDGIVIGEVWEDASNKIAYGIRREYFLGQELDSVMNYPLKNAILNYVRYGDEKILAQTVNEQIDHYPEKVIHSLMNLLSTHDTVRLITAVAGEDVQGKSKSEMAVTYIPDEKLDSAYFKLKVASLLQYTLYGVPSVYYGDEIGMQGYVDPLNRKCFPWGMENFDLISWYKKLGELRHSYSAFKNGEIKIVFSNNGTFVFKRSVADCEILISVNLGKKKYCLSFDGELYNLLDDEYYFKEYLLLPNSYAVLCKKIKKD